MVAARVRDRGPGSNGIVPPIGSPIGRIDIAVDLELRGSAELREALGQLAGAQMRLEMRISNPNEPVTVEAPMDAVPYPAG